MNSTVTNPNGALAGWARPLIGGLACLVILTGCGADGRSDSRLEGASNTLSGAALSDELRDARDAGCDARIIRALAPGGQHNGECNAPAFTELCGAQNLQAGLKIAVDEGPSEYGDTNPFLAACIREQSTEIGLVAACTVNRWLEASVEDCRCAAQAVISKQNDPTLSAWTASMIAGDLRGSKTRFADYHAQYPKGPIANSYAHLATFTDAVQVCQAGG